MAELGEIVAILFWFTFGAALAAVAYQAGRKRRNNRDDDRYWKALERQTRAIDRRRRVLEEQYAWERMRIARDQPGDNRTGHYNNGKTDDL